MSNDVKAKAFRTAYGVRKRVGYKTEGPTMAKQSDKAACDINRIMARWRKDGVLQHVNPITPHYGDFSELKDYQQSLNEVMAAQDAFMALPAHVRKRFGNDPADFISFASDPANADELVNLGLATRIVADPEAAPAAPHQLPT